MGFFFVPPYHSDGLAAAVIGREQKRPMIGTLMVHKRVSDPTAQHNALERRGFKFQVLNSSGELVAGSEFTTKSTGIGTCPLNLTLDAQYTLQETASTVAHVDLIATPSTMDNRTSSCMWSTR